jgi:hypothetical protein
VKSPVLVLALFVAAGGSTASAQVFVNPYVDTTLDAPSPTGNNTRAGFGVSFGNVGRIVGFETDLAYQPEIIDNTANALAKSRVLVFSGNVLVGPTIGRVKPYGAVGAGNLNLNVTSLSSVVIPNPTSFSNNYLTVNFGGGVMGFFTNHLGMRGDLRYFRAYGFDVNDFEGAGALALDQFSFWRANVGLAVKF